MAIDLSRPCPHGWRSAQSPCPLCAEFNELSPAMKRELEIVAAMMAEERQWFTDHGFPKYIKIDHEGRMHSAYEAWLSIEASSPAYRSPMAYRMFILGWLSFEKKLGEQLGMLRLPPSIDTKVKGKMCVVDKELDAVTASYVDGDE